MSLLSSRVMLLCLLCLFVLVIFGVSAVQKSGGYQLIEKPGDVKEFKKLLRTKTNVLVLFMNKKEETSAVNKWISVLSEAADTAFGKGTIAIVDCRDEGKKLCKKYKVSADPFSLKHFHNGEYHKDYDRLSTSESVVKFLLDPTGDIPWDEDATAKDVVHVEDGCGHCKAMKPDYVTAAGQLKEDGVSGALAAVDATAERTVATEFDIKGFPSVKYFMNGKYAWDFSERSVEKIVEFMKE